MNSIYMMLLAIYLFMIAQKINPKLEKYDYYVGLLVFISMICCLTSIIMNISKALI